MNKEKSAYSGWLLLWVLGMFQTIFAKAGKVRKSELANWYASYLDFGDIETEHTCNEIEYIHPASDDTIDEKDFFEQLIKWLDEIYLMSGVDINFKNTLIVIRKEWEKMVD